MTPRKIDWSLIHRRLELADAELARHQAQSPERIRHILEERARTLARVPELQEQELQLEILTFTLAAESYAVDIHHVREVCQLKNLTTLAGTPPFLAGVMNLRGRILAVIDLRRFFNLPLKGLTELNRVVVLADPINELGLLADSIDGIRQVPAASLENTLPTLTGIREQFLLGVTADLIGVLDGARLLSDTSLKINQSGNR